MVYSPSQITIAFSITALAMIGWYLVRAKEWLLVSFEEVHDYVRASLVAILVYSLFIYAPSLIATKFDANQMPIFFAAAITLQLFLAAIHLQPLTRSLILLGAGYLATSALPPETFSNACLAGITSLSVGKLIEIGKNKLPVSLEDVLAPSIWLTANIEIASPNYLFDPLVSRMCLLSVLTTTLLLRWIQPPFLKVDYLYVKRVALAATGAMLMVVAIVKFFDRSDIVFLAALIGLGFLIAYVLEDIDGQVIAKKLFQQTSKRALVIAFAAFLPMVFSSLSIGPSCYLLLAATMLVAESSYSATVLSLFLICQSLVTNILTTLTATAPLPTDEIALVLSAMLALAGVVWTSLNLGTRKDWLPNLVLIGGSFFVGANLLQQFPAYDEPFLNWLIILGVTISIWHQTFFDKKSSGQGQCLLTIMAFLCIVSSTIGLGQPVHRTALIFFSMLLAAVTFFICRRAAVKEPPLLPSK